jgi:hypothetical protein
VCGPGRSKCMSTLLPILALALALAAALLSKQPSDDPPVERGRTAATLWSLAIALILFLAAYVWRGWNSDASHVAIGLLAGAAGAIVSRWVPSQSRVVSSIALAGAVEGIVLWTPTDWRLLAQVGAIAGAALAAWILDVRSKASPSCAVFPIALASVVTVDLLGGKAMPGAGFAFSGTLMALVAGAAGVLSELATVRGAKPVYQQAIAIVLMGVGVFVLGWRYLQIRDAWMLYIGGIVVGLVVNWLMDDEGSDALRPLLSAIIWIGLATLGFGLRKGYGMSLGLMGGVSTLLLLGNVRALLSLGPLAGLVMYRVFREVHVDATKALDIGQHYALIGLTLGALAPLLPVEWFRSRMNLTGLRVPAAGVLWVVLLAVIPIGVAMVLGPKGVVGFVAGLGFASLLEAVRLGPSLQSLSLGLGLSAATTFVFQFLGDNTTLSRDAKTSILVPLSIGVTVLAIVLALVSPKASLKAVEAK